MHSSWGGNGTMYAHPNKDYIVTQTNVFKDMEAGGPLTSYAIALQKIGNGQQGPGPNL